MDLENLIKKYESWKDHASDEIELAYVTLFLADLKSLKKRDSVSLTVNGEGLKYYEQL
nr:MAG TPA: hypothetical protein [Caudoviricetes sp.]